MAIVIKEIHVCTTIGKEELPQLELTPEMVEKLRQLVQDEIERFRLDGIPKKER